MTDTPRPDRTLEEIAQKIARELFTNGQGQRADRLVLTKDYGAVVYLGGWCEGAIRDRILAALSSVQARTREERACVHCKGPNPIVCNRCHGMVAYAFPGTREAVRDEGE